MPNRVLIGRLLTVVGVFVVSIGLLITLYFIVSTQSLDTRQRAASEKHALSQKGKGVDYEVVVRSMFLGQSLYAPEESSNVRQMVDYSEDGIEKDEIIVKLTKTSKKAFDTSLRKIYKKNSSLKITSESEINKVTQDAFKNYSVDYMEPVFKGTARMELLGRTRGGKVLSSKISSYYLVKFSDDINVPKLIAQLKTNPAIEVSQPNYRVRLYFEPDDPYYFSSGSWGQKYDDLWGHKIVSVESAWKGDITGNGIVVAVVDTGLDRNHEDILPNVWVNDKEKPNNQIDDDGNGYVDDVFGWNFFDDTKDVSDNIGHGTHVSGIIAATGANKIGVLGIAPHAKIMPLKGFGKTGGKVSDLAEAILYAVQNGAKVINNSWGCYTRCPSDNLIESVVTYAYENGVVVVFSAGNSNDDVSYYSPQNTGKVITVGASTQNDERAFFSNYGELIDVYAPGSGVKNDSEPNAFRNILSLKSSNASSRFTGNGDLIVGGKYVRQAGTSMSAPYVSGVAALLLEDRKHLSPEKVKRLMQMSSDSIENDKDDAGRVNVEKAIRSKNIPVLNITSPRIGTLITPETDSEITISGNAYIPSGFETYRLLYKKDTFDNTSDWITISKGSNPVQNAVLGVMKTEELKVGKYMIKLQMTTKDGITLQDMTNFYIEGKVNRLIDRTGRGPMRYSIDVYKNYIVWADKRRGNWDIYLYDTEKQAAVRITASKSDQMNPKIYGNVVVWTDYRNDPNPNDSYVNTDIYMYDIKEKIVKPVVVAPGTQWNADIYDNIVGWVDYRDSPNRQKAHIYVKDLRTGVIDRITNHEAFMHAPSIYKNRIVWADARNGFSNMDVFMYDLATNREVQITTNDKSQGAPSIWGDTIAWVDTRDMTISNGVIYWPDIYYFDLKTKTEHKINNSPVFDAGPRVFGDIITWNTLDTNTWYGDTNIFMFNVSNKRLEQVTAHPREQWMPVASEDGLYWIDLRNSLDYSSNVDIYMVPLDAPVAIGSGDSRCSLCDVDGNGYFDRNDIRVEGGLISCYFQTPLTEDCTRWDVSGVKGYGIPDEKVTALDYFWCNSECGLK